MQSQTHRAIGSFVSIFEPLEKRAMLSTAPLGSGGLGDNLSGDASTDSNGGKADTVTEWNSWALYANAADHHTGAPHLQAGPGRSSRALAIVQGAIFDAVNAIDRSYNSWLVTDVKPSGSASIDAAAAQAGHDTLVALYPYLASTFDAALAADLKKVSGPTGQRGVDVGKAVAAEVLAIRAGDHSGDVVSYTPGTQPGQWRPDPLHPTQTAVGPEWGHVTPFGLNNVSQVAVPPPPALTSQAYADAYNEVKAYGAKNSVVRTADQTIAGIYWGYDGTNELGTPPRLYNQIAQLIAKQQHNSEVENARFLALVNFAMADAGISCWSDKFIYNFWRPITAIRENDAGTGPSGLGSQNPYLVGAGDPTWEPLGAPNDNGGGTNFTPPFPAYASGHATFGGAVFRTIADYYGTDNIKFTFVSDEFNGVTKDQNGIVRPLTPRTFNSLSQASEENAQSRIYLGIHWSFDKVQGMTCGTHIADWDFTHMLQPVKKGGGHGNALPIVALPVETTLGSTPDSSPEGLPTDQPTDGGTGVL